MNRYWHKLLEFETRDGINKFYKKRFNREISAEKVDEITSNFKQWREYFRSAEASDFIVKPLLQYYWVLALSRWLVLALRPWLRETQLIASHWLDIKNWPHVLSTKKFEELEIYIGKGSFSMLLDATDNKNFLKVNSSQVNWNSLLNKPNSGDKISLYQLMQYYPDLNSEFKSWTDEDLVYARLESFNIDEKTGIIKITLKNSIAEDKLEKLFPQEYCLERTHTKNIVSYNHSLNNWSPNITQKWDWAFDIWEACIVPVIWKDIWLNLICGMFAMSYVFWMLSRYYPTVWIWLQRGITGDRIYPFANRILEFINDKYPKVVLDFMDN